MGMPLVLDLFCGAGGASDGYVRAGYRVLGVDIEPMPQYPYPFIQGDAFDVDAELLASATLIHASPPCQAYSPMANRWRGAGGKADTRTKAIPAVEAMLRASGRPWVIENVRGSDMVHGFELTGGMFGLGVHRPRKFKASFDWRVPSKVPPPEGHVGIYGNGMNRLLWKRSDGSELRSPETIEIARQAMGINRPMTWGVLKEAIPPAYTEYIGNEFRRGYL